MVKARPSSTVNAVPSSIPTSRLNWIAILCLILCIVCVTEMISPLFTFLLTSSAGFVLGQGHSGSWEAWGSSSQVVTASAPGATVSTATVESYVPNGPSFSSAASSAAASTPVSAAATTSASSQSVLGGSGQSISDPWPYSSVPASLTASLTLSAAAGQYTNPILQQEGADPWVVKGNDSYYYMTYTTNDNVTILRSQSLTDWNNAEVKLAFLPPMNTPYSYDMWAPELHWFPEYQRWYIIYTADVDPDSPPPLQDMLCDFGCPAVNHRNFVLESSGTDPWESTYSMKGELDTYNQFSIDGTYFQHHDKLYHVYSCWYTNSTSWPAMLCISEMSDPWTVSSPYSDRAIISKPDQPWEQTPYGRSINVRLATNEGPEQLTNPYTNQTFIIYSGARSTNPDYCLGLLELTGDDPLQPSSWTKHTEGPVFYASDQNQAYGVGHASFVDADGEWFVIYHGMREYINGWSDRTIRAQQFTWDEQTGYPVFPRPGYGPYAVPTGY